MIRRWMLGLATMAVLGLAVIGHLGDARAEDGGPSDEAIEDHACLSCHAVEEDGAPLVEAHHLLTVHADLECIGCHEDYEDSHPDEMGTPIGCGACHDDAVEALLESVHAGLLGDDPEDEETTAACVKCHSAHDVFPEKHRKSTLFPLEVPKTCGACHDTQKYADDTHAHSLLAAGLVTAPTCVTCHGGHDVKEGDDATAPMHPSNVSRACGECHVGIYERYAKSIHGTTPRDGEGREPATCTDCHKPHAISRVDGNFKLQTVATCNECHGDRGRTYYATYHGKIAAIGYDDIASCDDCHTAHDILPSSDPLSSVHMDNRVETCARCHEGAHEQFVTYEVHADPDDKEGYPVLYWARVLMRGLILGTWAMWGIHTLLWLIRSLKDRKKIQAHLKPVSGRWYKRWPWSYRAIHLTLVFSFLLLAMTGLPLRFHTAPWASFLFDLLGGSESVRNLHRFGAILTGVYTLAFLVMIGVRFARGEKGLFHGPNSLLPRVEDAKHMGQSLRWFVKGGQPPQFDRWTYFEKFDFIAEVWGVMFIGITGLIMWYPVFFTQFMPGWAVNLAHILHSYEALLATSFIFTMHFFNSNLRPGKFPVDGMFLHGRISEEELKHERPAEYERMRADGRLVTEALPPPNEAQVLRARVIGITLMSIGLVLLFFMVSTLF